MVLTILKHSKSCVLMISCILSVALTGCGGKYTVAPVSGVITLDGKPLADVTVRFMPRTEGGTDVPASTGRTDNEGKYTLAMVADNTRGALIGQHDVRIARNIESESDIMTIEEVKKSYLPPHDFTFEVKSGSNQADFDLSSGDKGLASNRGN